MAVLNFFRLSEDPTDHCYYHQKFLSNFEAEVKTKHPIFSKDLGDWKEFNYMKLRGYRVEVVHRPSLHGGS